MAQLTAWVILEVKKFSHCTFDCSDDHLQENCSTRRPPYYCRRVNIPVREDICSWIRPIKSSTIIYILRSNRSTLKLGYPEYLLNKPIVSSRSSLNILLEDGFTIAGLLTPSTPVMANIPFLWSRSTILWASSCTSLAVNLYRFGVIPVPNVLVTWFAHSMTTTILTRCIGTSEKTVDHTSCKFVCSNLVKGPLHPGNGVLG